MTLDEDDCWARLAAARHGVLATVHPSRGVDAVPVVFAVVGRRIVVPVDTVKPKRSTALRRLANLESDPRCVLLVEGWDEDWSRLWWVRVHARGEATAPAADLVAALTARYPQYAATGAVAGVVVLTPEAVAGWAAG